MRPEIFPTEKIEKLYKDLESEQYSDKARYAKLKQYGLVGICKHEGKTHYVHPNHQWKTYMFRIPICSSGKAQERTNRSKFIAFKNVIVKWIFARPTMEKVDEKFFIELRSWFAKHMTGYATVSIPTFLSEDFEDDFSRTQNELVCITPNLERASCPECNHLFTIDTDDKMLECPNCGFTFIK